MKDRSWSYQIKVNLDLGTEKPGLEGLLQQEEGSAVLTGRTLDHKAAASSNLGGKWIFFLFFLFFF